MAMDGLSIRIAVVNALHLKVAAEYMETSAQPAHLQEHDYGQMQSYPFSKPAPREKS